VDELYELTKSGSFQVPLAAFFEHAFLPLLQYAYYLYPQPNAWESISPTKKMDPHLTVIQQPQIELTTSESFAFKQMVQTLSIKGKVHLSKLKWYPSTCMNQKLMHGCWTVLGTKSESPLSAKYLASNPDYVGDTICFAKRKRGSAQYVILMVVFEIE